jgi:hypothetical protein
MSLLFNQLDEDRLPCQFFIFVGFRVQSPTLKFAPCVGTIARKGQVGNCSSSWRVLCPETERLRIGDAMSWLRNDRHVTGSQTITNDVFLFLDFLCFGSPSY